MLKNLKHLLTNTDVSLVYGLVLLFYFSVALLFSSVSEKFGSVPHLYKSFIITNRKKII